MQRFTITLVSTLALAVSLGTTNAWHISGRVYCDVNRNGLIDSEDTPFSDVGVRVVSTTPGLAFDKIAVTGKDGAYYLDLLDKEASYVAMLDTTTLPSDAVILLPANSRYEFTLTDADYFLEGADWLFRSSVCSQGCWLTGGGVKFEPIVNDRLATSGPADTIGGNVFPGCSSTAGQGGQWNHVAHSLKLHFQGFVVDTVDCGNVPGIEPGSESPVTPFNFIEFSGTGRLKGIKGNKVDYPLVYFFARCEDRNEPGSRGANDGELIDRYYIHVFDGSGNTLLLVNGVSGPTPVVPVPITGGNLQLHISSCP